MLTLIIGSGALVLLLLVILWPRLSTRPSPLDDERTPDDEMEADAVREVLRTGRPVIATRDDAGKVTIRVLGDE